MNRRPSYIDRHHAPPPDASITTPVSAACPLEVGDLACHEVRAVLPFDGGRVETDFDCSCTYGE